MPIHRFINKKVGYICPNCGEHFTMHLEANLSIMSDRYIVAERFNERGYMEIGDDKNGAYLYDTLINPLCDKCDCHFAEIDIDIYEAVCKFVKAGMKTAYCCSGHTDAADGDEQVIQLIKEAKEKNSFFLYEPNWEEVMTHLDQNEYEECCIDGHPITCYIDFVKDDEINKALHKVIGNYLASTTKYVRDHFVIKLFDKTERYHGVSQDGQPISELVVAFSRSIYMIMPQDEKKKILERLIKEANTIMLNIAIDFKEEYVNGQQL